MTGDKWAMLTSFAPYGAMAAYDGWLHEKARRVPKVEQAFHAVAALALIALLWGLFGDRPALAVAALILFAATVMIDELGFHGRLHRHERRLHAAAYAAFALFALVSWRVGGFG